MVAVWQNRAMLGLLVAALLVLAGFVGFGLRGCQETGNEAGGVVYYDLTGDLTVSMDRDRPCKGELPTTVKLTAEIVKGESTSTKTEIVSANGRFTIRVPWIRSLGAPDSWIVDRVVRLDGSPICEHSLMQCPEGLKCLDVVTQHERGGFLPDGTTTQLQHRVICGCR